MNARPPMPQTLPPALQGFTAFKQWVNYKLVPKPGGKNTKIPIREDGAPASTTNPAEWMTYDEAAATGRPVGFVFTDADPFFFLDIDGARLPDGSWSTRAQELLRRTDGCAVEISSSGKGLHIFGVGSISGHSSRRDDLGLEFYTRSRFVALTGNMLTPDGSVFHAPPELPALVAEYFPPSQHQAATDWTDGPCEGWAGPTDDDELVRRASRHVSASGAFAGKATFADLWNAAESLGNVFPPTKDFDPYNRSSADAALCAHLAFWTGKDCERMARLLRASGLARDKHDREDYVQRTVLRACGLVKDVLTDKPLSTSNIADQIEAAKSHGPRYKLLSAAELRHQPPLIWRVRGALPAKGLAALYGPSGSGKSFLAFDMAAAIAEGEHWFGCRVTPAPVVYAALEGEAGFKQRAQAWEKNRGRDLPNDLRMMLQPFKLTDLKDVFDLAAVLPTGAVVVLDTLNRAAPESDENASKDMGQILEAAKTLQAACNGLVLLVHHTGKDSSKGLRGHSSLFAAMDAAIEVTRNGERRSWKIAKSKDGIDGDSHSFKLRVETLGFEDSGEPITSCVVALDTALEEVKVAKPPSGGNQRVILNALRELLQKATPHEPDSPPRPTDLPALVLERAIPLLAERLTVPPARKNERTREAITGLINRDVVCVDKGWIWLT